MIGKYFSLFKLFFPSWNFFGGSTDTPYLMVKYDQEFVPVFPPPPTKLLNLFYNPYGNLYLAHHSNMQALLNELYTNQDLPEFKLENSPIYAIAKNWVEYFLYQQINKPHTYCFKFAYIKKNNDKIEIVEDIFTSPEYELL